MHSRTGGGTERKKQSRTFDNVNLAPGGPVGTVAPKRWPCPASLGHVCGVHDDKPACVCELGRDAHALAEVLDLWGSLYAHHGMACVVDVDEAGGLLFVEGMSVGEGQERSKQLTASPWLR